MFNYEGIEISWLGHAGFKIKKDRIIYIDPYQLQGSPEKGDMVLITHEHFDHLSIEDLKKVVGPDTVIVTIPTCEGKVQRLKPKRVEVLWPGDKKNIEGVEVETVPAYNTNKFRSPGAVFHPKGEGKVGFILTLAGRRVYHAGDTDNIPEMERAKGVDVALLPVSGTYVMTFNEAIEACRTIQPKVAIPMHYGAIVGSAEDARRFKEGAPSQVEVLERV